MKALIEFLTSIRFDTQSIGIQKDLLLASLIGTVVNLPKDIKSNLLLAVHIISGTLLSTILTPFVMLLVGKLLNTTLDPSMGYGMAALIGIVGVNTIKKILIDKITSSKTKDDNDTDTK